MRGRRTARTAWEKGLFVLRPQKSHPHRYQYSNHQKKSPASSRLGQNSRSHIRRCRRRRWNFAVSYPMSITQTLIDLRYLAVLFFRHYPLQLLPLRWSFPLSRGLLSFRPIAHASVPSVSLGMFGLFLPFSGDSHLSLSSFLRLRLLRFLPSPLFFCLRKGVL